MFVRGFVVAFVAGLAAGQTEKSCSDLKCPVGKLFSGSFTNASYFWDEDFQLWRPNMEFRTAGFDGTWDPALSATVHWQFGGAGSCASGNGVMLSQVLTVWGQPPSGPPQSALDFGSQLPETQYCCTVEGTTTQGRCHNKRCALSGQPCEVDATCGVCNMVMVLEKPATKEAPHPNYDRHCAYMVAASRMRLNYLSYQSDKEITGKEAGNHSIIVANENIPSKPPSGTTTGEEAGGQFALDSLILEVEEDGQWPMPQCSSGAGSSAPFPNMSTYTSAGCRGCVNGQCANQDRINCLNARLKLVPDFQPSWPFLVIVISGALLFLASWAYLFWSVPILDSSGGDGGDAAQAASTDVAQGLNTSGDAAPVASSPYVNRRSQLRCGNCGSSVDNKNAKFCPFCGADASHFLAYNDKSGVWEGLKTRRK